MLAKVASSPLPKRKVLRELGIPKSTYYRWLRRKDQQRLEDDAGGGKPVWNRLTFQEVRYVLSAARQLPELSCRQLAAWITDNQGFSVSESTVYRILRREGLVKSPEMQLAAGKEFHRKTTRPHQMWATDASYFRVVGWGYYYMVTTTEQLPLHRRHKTRAGGVVIPKDTLHSSHGPGSQKGGEEPLDWPSGRPKRRWSWCYEHTGRHCKSLLCSLPVLHWARQQQRNFAVLRGQSRWIESRFNGLNRLRELHITSHLNR